MPAFLYLSVPLPHYLVPYFCSMSFHLGVLHQLFLLSERLLAQVLDDFISFISQINHHLHKKAFTNLICMPNTLCP